VSTAQDCGGVPPQTDTIELTPPEIARYQAGNTGIPFVTTHESGRPGPHVMVCALMHGNEISGAYALDHLHRHDVRPVYGQLSLVFANVAAYGLFDRGNPYAARFVDEDMNRLWNPETLSRDFRSVERVRARALRPLIDRVDHLLDLHSMLTGVQPLLLCGPSEKGRAFARRLASPATIVADSGHADGTRLRDYGRFNTPGDPRTSLLAECGPHWHTGTAEMAIDTAYRFLLATGTIAAETATAHLGPTAPPDQWVEVTHRFVPQTDNATFVRPFTGLETIPDAGTVFARDGNREIVTPFDNCVLIMPARRLAKGQTGVRLGRWCAFAERDHG
jgi:predicted deacylase